MGSSLHTATGPAKSLLQHRLPTGSQLPSCTSPCSSLGFSSSCRWRSAPLWTSMGCRGTACLTMVCSRGCRGISAQVPGAHPALLLHWPWCLQGCFSYIFSPLSSAVIAVAQFFFPLLNYVIPEALPQSLVGSALASSGAGWHQLCRTLGKLLAASHRSHPYSPTTSKTVPPKPNTVSSIHCTQIHNGIEMWGKILKKDELP